MPTYAEFLNSRQHTEKGSGLRPSVGAAFLYDFQSALLEWALKLGRAAVFADCGLGKTPLQLSWAQSIVEQTNKHALIVTPLAVTTQTVREAQKFGIEAVRSQDGSRPASATIVVTNYERLHHFDPQDYIAVVCDESSILKNFDGATKAAVTEFMRTRPYRLLCTATAAPNDYIELGTSSEAVGDLGYTDMLTMFFKNDESSLAPLSHSSKWRFKPHASGPFWQWLCSWARAMRKPSDLGFSDGRFTLPTLNERVTVVSASRPLNGMLFAMPARDLQEQRQERRATIVPRCERVAQLAASHDRPFIAWCHLNDEGDTLERMIPGSIQVSGSDPDEEKVEKFESFVSGQARVLVTKPRIAGFGLNWQHCSDMSMFPSHSYEQYYQSVRRCWRYGQARDVMVDIITTEGEADVLANLTRKSGQADQMFAEMLSAMGRAMGRTKRQVDVTGTVTVPSWMEGVCSLT